MEVIAFIKENYVGFLLGMASCYPIMKGITKLTPWSWDDTLLENGRVIFKKVTTALGVKSESKVEEETVETGMKQASDPGKPPANV